MPTQHLASDHCCSMITVVIIVIIVQQYRVAVTSSASEIGYPSPPLIGSVAMGKLLN